MNSIITLADGTNDGEGGVQNWGPTNIFLREVTGAADALVVYVNL